MKSKSKTFIVLGAHKSGTSVVANILHELGVNMGSELLPEDSSNLFGHYEDISFVQINEKILEGCQSPWYEPTSRLRVSEFGFPPVKDDFIELIKERESLQQDWGWKDPRNTLTMFSLVKYLTNPHFIVVRRNIHDTAKSLHSRDSESKPYRPTMEYAANLTQYYWDECTLFMDTYKGSSPVLEVDYDLLIEDKRAGLKPIAEFVGADQDKTERALSCIRDRSEIEIARKLITS